MKVKSVKKRLINEEVYDVSVEGNHNLVVNGVVCHNCHRMAAPMFSQALPKFNAKYRVGLSATVHRKDGLENVFFHAVGPIVARHDTEEMTPVIKRVFMRDRIFREGYPFRDVPLGRIITTLTKSQGRNRVIAEQIVQAVKAERKIIIMSERLAQLDDLMNYVSAMLHAESLHLKYSMGKYVGGMAQAELDNSAKKDIIMSTYQMAAEALDIPDLDTIILASPKSDVQQSVGRILRKCDKKQPIVVDVVDTMIPPFAAFYKRRMKFYQEKGWVGKEPVKLKTE